MKREPSIPVPGRNLGDYVKEAAIIGGIIAGVHAAGNTFSEPVDADRPVTILNPSKSYAELILADRKLTERLR